MLDDLPGLLREISVWAIPILVAVTFHEAAHGFVAWRLGDDTARRLGRVTFNPIRHIDPFGTIVLPGMLLLLGGFIFGYAKPVPVNFRRLRHPRRDMVWVALAGPGTNIALAFVSALLLHVALVLPAGLDAWVFESLDRSIWINLVLAVFNMLPLPPLDGGRVAVGILPDPLAMPLARLERYGLLILLGILFVLPMIGTQLGVDLALLPLLLGAPVQFLYELVAAATGWAG